MRLVSNILRAAAIGAVFYSGSVWAADIEVKGPWTRATVHGASVAVGFLTIENKGAETDRLTSASADVAEKVELHETRMENGVMQMRALPQGAEIKPGATLVLKPGSYHLMLLGLKGQLLPGGAVHLTLTFSKAGQVEVTMPVETVGATGPVSAAKPAEKPAH